MIMTRAAPARPPLLVLARLVANRWGQEHRLKELPGHDSLSSCPAIAYAPSFLALSCHSELTA